jgi:hypothetical protein
VFLVLSIFFPGCLPPLPACLALRSLLYNPDVNVSDYYNTTTEVVSGTGAPFGFFHHPLKGGRSVFC